MQYSPQDSLFAYQPILDGQHHSVALALLHRQAESCLPADADDDGSLATARVVVNAYLSSELMELLGNRKVFVNINEDFLTTGMASILPASKVVLQLVPNRPVTDETRALCKEFKGMGYTLALDDYVPSERLTSLLDEVDVVKLDIRSMPRDKLTQVFGMLRERDVKLLAEKVESQEDFEYCRDLGFDLFQGYFFARPKVLVGRRPDPKRTNIINILSLINQDAGDKQIEDALKRSPDLTLHLLRLVNSAAFGLRSQVGSVREAIQLFGRNKLGKWLQILLFMSGEEGGTDWALFEMSAKRGRMIEMLVEDATHQKGSSQQERGFMVGMLSLVDVLLGSPMDEVLPQIGVVEDIQWAIMDKAGVPGALLSLCEALEMADFDGAIEIAGRYSITLARVMDAQREAALWAHGLVGENFPGAS